ncbi:MAG: alpha/beta fold hydrolase [Patescibacteria group bacterium]
MNITEEKIPVDSKTIFTKFWNAENPKALLVSLHGAGTSDHSRFEYQIPNLLAHNISVLVFDFSGHGESSGTLTDSSLEKRVNEAQAVIDFHHNRLPLILCGSSMGGYIAVKLLELFSIQALILFAPAMYSKEAYTVPFGGGFTEIIRKPESWRDSDAWDILKQFKGRLLTIIGENDEVIPSPMIDLIHSSVTHALSKENLIVPAASHAIHNFLKNHSEQNKKVQKKMIEYA